MPDPSQNVAATSRLRRGYLFLSCEVLLQASVYCGVPDANAAFRVAQRVLDEAEGQRDSP
jgi:hypothetical protein